MSYDINLIDPVSNDVLLLEDAHHMTGGTYQLGGSNEASLNVTYNYSKICCEAFGCDTGIRTIYGLTGLESIPVLEGAISKLGNDVDADYWKPTEGNVKRALSKILTLAKMRPDGIWDGD